MPAPAPPAHGLLRKHAWGAGLQTLSIAALLALASCKRLPDNEACGGVIICLSSRHGIVLGEDSSARIAAARELQAAAAAYSAWFDGKVPERGLVILDAPSAGNSRFIRKPAWTLNFDRSANRGLEGASASPASGGAPFELSRADGGFDMGRPGVLAHEICHHHAARAFELAWGKSRILPDMLDEVAAISCESADLKAERVSQFLPIHADGTGLPWQAFLATRHPLKDGEAIEALGRLAGGAEGAVRFDIKPGSVYGARIALFYAQAAAFGAFLSARSCKGMEAIGGLLSTYDSHKGLDRWLRSYGERFCLPSSLGEFEKSFSKFVEEKRRSGV